MSLFTKRPLQFLDRVYKFVGGLGTTLQVDLDSPIVLVHDVGISAEKRGPGVALGWWQRSITLVHPAADTQTGSFDPYALLASDFGVDPEELWVWVYDWAGFRTAGGGAMTFGTVFVTYPTIVVAFPDPTAMPLVLWNGIDSGSAQAVQVRDTQRTTVPSFIPPGSTLNFTALSAAAATYKAQFLMWAGPRGVQPFIMSGRG